MMRILLTPSTRPYLVTFYFFVLCVTLSGILYLVYYCIASSQTSRGSRQRTNDSISRKSSRSRSNGIQRIDQIATEEQENGTKHRTLNESQSSTIYLNLLLVASLSFLWYSVSISFTIYNRYLMKSYRGGFDYPFAITFAHMCVKYLFSRLYVYLMMSDGVPPIKVNIYTNIVIPIGVTTALDIALSNMSISYVTISLYTILKTTVVVWTFIWGGIAGLETVSIGKGLSILGVVCGLSLAVLSDIQASLWGILAASSSAALAGLRWVLMQSLQVADDKSRSSIIAMYRFSAVTVLAIFPLVLIFELPSLIQSKFVQDANSIIEVIELLFVGSIVGCLLIIIELNLLTLTSSLTLSIIGELKEAIQILLGMIAFHERFTYISGAGVALAISSAEVYRRIKGTEPKESDKYDFLPDNSNGDLDSDDVELMKLIYDTDDVQTETSNDYVDNNDEES